MYTPSSSLSLTQNNILVAPNTYWNLSDQEKENTLNGCGPKGLLTLLTPNHFFGVNVKQACDIHDYMYSRNSIERTREIADKIFLRNMNAIIEKESSSFVLKLLRKAKAYTYYFAVSLFGGLFSSRSVVQSN